MTRVVTEFGSVVEAVVLKTAVEVSVMVVVFNKKPI
jgi:hypothetical protein